MTYKAILFDLDDTLCDTTASKLKVFDHIREENPKLQKLSRTDTIELLRQEREKYLKAAQGFQTYARVEFWLKVIRKINAQISVRELKKIIDDYWKYTLEELSLFEDASLLLQQLQNKGYQTAVLASSDFYSKAGKLIKLNIDQYFNFVFTSDILKLSKTEATIYTYVAKFLKLKPEEILMVGDNPQRDITPAKKAGLTTVQTLVSGNYKIAKRGASRPHFAVYNLRAILDIINGNHHS